MVNFRLLKNYHMQIICLCFYKGRLYTWDWGPVTIALQALSLVDKVEAVQVYGWGTCRVTSHPHKLVPGHQRTVSTNKVCNQWLSLAKTLLKVALAGGNRSLVARTSKCGWAFTGAGYQRTASESQWLQPMLVLIILWWPNSSKCGWVVSERKMDVKSMWIPYMASNGQCFMCHLDYFLQTTSWR